MWCGVVRCGVVLRGKEVAHPEPEGQRLGLPKSESPLPTPRPGDEIHLQ